MRMVDGKIKTFKTLLNSIFYDWGFGSGVQPFLHSSEDGFWINKTCIFKEEEKYYLTYKMESYEVEEEAFAKLEIFYELYKNDQDFWTLLNSIENNWNDNSLLKTKTGFTLGNLEIHFDGNNYQVKEGEYTYLTSEACIKKLQKMYSLLVS